LLVEVAQVIQKTLRELVELVVIEPLVLDLHLYKVLP
tara:strand:- start:716 stop:826 length:111 start_codon:yes stop_codon:yes gene_type:complete